MSCLIFAYSFETVSLTEHIPRLAAGNSGHSPISASLDSWGSWGIAKPASFYMEAWAF